ncbi:Type-F conjugative transfer system protein [Legionella busanensis]|uniref:Type-F conjugative transfer system protein n=1 Tax=Legionella busanensis TaxID=190655 RepID=A0A378KDV4_9GAMM|nr:type-F conjugative transfer system protein TraW [Legionella busanensis]STX81711.1 Type-F conjugative transfer system protein [Legionella busanensis]
MNLLCLIILLALSIGQTHAKSFGVVGEVFPVAEKSFLMLIEERLATLKASGALDAINMRWVQTAAEHANRPEALALSRATVFAEHKFIPEVTLNQDITDAGGRVLFAHGTTVNALAELPAYRPCWLFFNAEDDAQLHWAAQQKTSCASPKFILTGGAINTTERRLQSIIYFDQGGRITRKLHIAHVPAKVIRHQNHLVIQEMAIKENGDVL